MPELPDVEIFRRYFNSTSLNKKIEKIIVKSPEMLSDVKKNDLINNLKGEKFISSERHGKYMFASLKNGNALVLHFGMTGYLAFYENKSDAPKYTKLLIIFNNGNLAFNDSRKLGLISYTGNIPEYISKKKLGPDALKGKIKIKDFYKMLHKRSAPVKAVLMNQEVIAGIGNVYADEILYHSSIDPHSTGGKIPEAKLEELFKNIMKILTRAIMAGAEPSAMPDDYLLNYRKKKKKCPKCGGDILISRIGGRTTYYCKKHQKKFS